MNFSKICSKVIKTSFHLLFFLVPLVFSPLNFELFEYNKIMLTYTITIIICTFWGLKMISEKRFYFKKTPLDFPLFLFLLSQIVSTIFSLDPHTSIFGYYSRFHGGLLSTICYIALYYALVSNLEKNQVTPLLSTMLFSGTVVAIYGLLQHPNPFFAENGVWHGIDYKYWVQDVELRVFSTIGQPNWLAAYLSMLIPIAIVFMLNQNSLRQKLIFFLLTTSYYLCLLFTNSRAGGGGFFAGFFVFLLLLFWRKKGKKTFLTSQNLLFLFLLLLTFGLLTLSAGRFLLKRFEEIISPKIFAATQIPKGETAKIRNIVWKGAVEIFKHYPLFGSGVETFAYSYYQFRPKEHNFTTEWDFLYNKAHNEYLNFLATTGIFGFASYMFLIFSFLWWSLKKLLFQPPLPPKIYLLILALFSSYLSYLVQNFYGFSVVPIALFFFLFPPLTFLLTDSVSSIQFPAFQKPFFRFLCTFLLVSFTLFCLFSLGKMYLADIYYARAHTLAQTGFFDQSYLYIKKATKLNSNEPLYFDQLAYDAAVLATQSEEATSAAQLAQEAISSSQKALAISPFNVNFWKTAIKVFYQLGVFDAKFYQKAEECAKIAIELSPTDPKLPYNLGLIYLTMDKNKEAIESIQKAIELKPDLKDPHYALAIIYHQEATKSGKEELFQKAKEELEYILKNIDPGAIEVQEKLKEWKEK